MPSNRNYDGLDRFKIIAAVLVIAIHTGPLMSHHTYADFMLTSILGRLAVPFFFVVSGFFLFSKQTDRHGLSSIALRRYAYKIGILYAISIILYLPLNLYAGHFKDDISVYGVLKMVIFDGTFYHLWYLPALIIGVYIVYFLSRKLSLTLLLVVTGLLYTIGLFGDSYYGIAEHIPVMNSTYNTLFTLFDYTRNGLFYAPVFLTLGLVAANNTQKILTQKVNAIFFIVSLSLMLIEGIILKQLELPRHDSMYIFLLPAVYFLFQLLMRQLRQKGNGGAFVRKLSLWIYILHPIAIVLIRGIDKLTGRSSIWVTNSLIHFIAVTMLSFILAALIIRLSPITKSKQQKLRAWAEINLAHLEHNVSQLKSALPSNYNMMAVVKADAYGHGSIQVAKHLNKAGVRFFAVADISEGIVLRNNGVKGDILILGETCETRFSELVHYRLQQTVISADYAEHLNAYGRKIDVHIKIDTGMGRLGECFENMERVISMYQHKNLQVFGTYSHLSVSDSLEESDIAYTYKQINRFNKTVDKLMVAGIDPGVLHIQSSYGIINYPKLSLGSDMGRALARPGIALYGILSHEGETVTELDLRPVLSLKANIVQVKQICANSPIGYGHECIATQDSKIAIVSIGYADGIPRAYSDNGGYTLIQGQKATIIGKICMDHLLVDVTDIDDVKYGDIATFIGQDGHMEITTGQMAKHCNTITNEILSRIGNRVEKVYSKMRKE